MNKSFKKGFTLIELLVVVGILAVLAIAALIAINPAEAQRRSRDTVRLQDLARLQAAIETEIDTNGYINLGDGAVHNVQSTADAAGAVGNIGSQPCALNWIRANLCHTLRQTPIAPLNSQNLAFRTPTGGGAATTNLISAYALHVDAGTGQYEICTRLEAESNVARLAVDGGADNVFSAGSAVGIGCQGVLP